MRASNLCTLTLAVLASALAAHATARHPFAPGIAVARGPTLATEAPAASTAPATTPAPNASATAGTAARMSGITLVNKVDQAQTGLLNQQSAEIANTRSLGKSTQTQNGALNRQEKKLGVATEGNKADVTARDVNQTQRGFIGDQKVNVGNSQ